MKIDITEFGIRLTPETGFERECLQKIGGKQLTARFADEWDRTGPVELTYDQHPWDERR